MDNTINNPHDHLFRHAMADKRVAIDFLKQHLPKSIQDIIDFNQLTLCKTSFVDKSLQLSEADVLYCTKFNNRPAYIYLLCEHQSSIDALMAFRILQYQVKIMAYHCKQHNTKVLPIVYPIVLYHGDKPYTASTDLFDCFGDHTDLARDMVFQPFQLIDLTQVEDDELQSHLWSGTLEMVFKHIFVRDFANLITKIKSQMSQIEQSDGTDFLAVVLKYILNETQEKDMEKVMAAIKTTLSPSTQEGIMTVADLFKEEGIKKGIKKGIKIGIEQGIEQGVEQGRTQGIEQGTKVVAIKLLKEGMPLELISKVTNLSMEQLETLKDDN